MLYLSKKNILLFILILVTSVAVFNYFIDNQQNNLLESELKDFIVSPVSIGRNVYYVKNGVVIFNGKSPSAYTSNRVLKSAYASVLNRLDPILGIDGTDPDELKKSVEDLDKFVHNFASLYKTEEETALNTTLYPLDFLKSTAEAERARQNLMKAPSLEQASRYYEKLRDSLDYSVSYAGKLEIIFRDMNDPGLAGDMIFLDGDTRIELYPPAFRNFQSQVEARKKDLSKRIDCLNDFTLDCPSLKKAFQKITTTGEFYNATQDEPLPKNIVDNKRLMGLFINSVLNQTSKTGNDFPVILLKKSSCFTNENKTYYQPWIKLDKENNNIFKLHTISDLYFYPEQDYPLSLVPESERRGIAYLYQSAANLYMCSSSGNDLTRAITLDTIYNSLLHQTKELDLDFKKNNADIFDLKNKIVSGNVIYEPKINLYVEKLKLLLSKNGESELAKKFGDEEVLYIEKLISIYNQKSPRFNEVIRSIMDSNARIEQFAKKGGRIRIDVIFLSRSQAQTILLSYNKSFVENPIKLSTPQDFDISKFKLVSYNKVIKNKYSENQVLDMMLKWTKLENN